MQRLNTILLVDDDEITNFIHKELIADLEICENVVLCANGMEALDYMRSKNEDGEEDLLPELIFLDINMPVMNGREFVEGLESLSLRKKPRVVVMLTTMLNPKDRLILEKSPYIADFKDKPLTAEKIVILVNETMKD